MVVRVWVVAFHETRHCVAYVLDYCRWREARRRLREVAAGHGYEDREHPHLVSPVRRRDAAAAMHGAYEVVVERVYVDVLVLAPLGVTGCVVVLDVAAAVCHFRADAVHARADLGVELALDECDGEVVAVDRVEDRVLEVTSVFRELDVGLAAGPGLEEPRLGGVGCGCAGRLRVVLDIVDVLFVVDYDDLVVAHGARLPGERLDHVEDDLALEDAVADVDAPLLGEGLRERRARGEHGAGVDVLLVGVALALRHRLGGRDEAVVVEREDHGVDAAREVPPYGPCELAVDERVPVAHVVLLHELDLPVDEDRLCVEHGRLGVRVRGHRLEVFRPAGVDCHASARVCQSCPLQSYLHRPARWTQSLCFCVSRAGSGRCVSRPAAPLPLTVTSHSLRFGPTRLRARPARPRFVVFVACCIYAQLDGRAADAHSVPWTPSPPRRAEV